MRVFGGSWKTLKLVRVMGIYWLVSLVLSAVMAYAYHLPMAMVALSALSLSLAALLGFFTVKQIDKIRAVLASYYKDEGAKITEAVAEVSKPYRRAALFHPSLIDYIVVGRDPYEIYVPFLFKKTLRYETYEAIVHQSYIGEHIFWGLFLELIGSGIIAVEPYEDTMAIFVKECRDMPSIILEICDVLQKASARESRDITFDREIYATALTVDTLKGFLSEVEWSVDTEEGTYDITRFQHVGILLFTHVITEFRPPQAYDVYPPVKLSGRIVSMFELYKTLYSAMAFLSTASWTLLLFGMTLQAVLASVVGFAAGYLYFPNDVYHPSLPWYNRYKVWRYLRKKVSKILPHRMSLEDASIYVAAGGEDKDNLIMAVYLGAVAIEK